MAAPALVKTSAANANAAPSVEIFPMALSDESWTYTPDHFQKRNLRQKVPIRSTPRTAALHNSQPFSGYL
jgi:hypothetical protein